MGRTAFLLAVLLAASCRAPVTPGTDAAEQAREDRLMQGCEEAERLLDQMRAAEPSFRYDEAGNASLRADLWASLPAAMQDGLVQAIAYRAICARGAPGEQDVTIRSVETSEVLAERTVGDFGR